MKICIFPYISYLNLAGFSSHLENSWDLSLPPGHPQERLDLRSCERIDDGFRVARIPKNGEKSMVEILENSGQHDPRIFCNYSCTFLVEDCENSFLISNQVACGHHCATTSGQWSSHIGCDYRCHGGHGRGCKLLSLDWELKELSFWGNWNELE